MLAKQMNKKDCAPECFSGLKNKPIIFMVIGLPGSGKSTWCRHVFGWDLYDMNNVSTDFFVEKYAQQKNKKYSEVWKKYNKDASILSKERLLHLINANQLVICDEVNLSPHSRKKILKHIPKNYRKIAIVFKIDENKNKMWLDKRAEKEGKIIPDDAIGEMKSMFATNELAEEGFDDIFVIQQ